MIKTIHRLVLTLPILYALPATVMSESPGPGHHDVHYPLSTFKYFRQNVVVAGKDADINFDARFIRFRAVVTYLGEYRPLSKSKKEKFDLLDNINVLHGKIHFFNYEVLIRDEGGWEFWIPANRLLAERIDEAIDEGEDFTAMLTYLGCCYEEDERILNMNRVDLGKPERIPRHTCFTDELLGVKVGADFTESFEQLEERYGPPFSRSLNEKKQDVAVFPVDEETKTAIYLRNGGPEYADTVSSIQLSTYNQGEMKFYKDLHLGATKQEAEAILGTPLSVRTDTKFPILYQKGSYCSFEMKDGKIFSVFVSEDPHY